MILFLRIYRITNLKHYTIKDFAVKASNRESMLDMWSRSLLGRDEIQIHALRVILNGIKLTAGNDRSEWIPGSGNFSTKLFAKQYLNMLGSIGSSPGDQNFIWSSKVPQKILIFL